MAYTVDSVSRKLLGDYMKNISSLSETKVKFDLDIFQNFDSANVQCVPSSEIAQFCLNACKWY